MTTSSLSLMFSGCFLALMIWVLEQKTVFSLVNEKLAVHPTTTTGDQTTYFATHSHNATYGGSSFAMGIDCRPISHRCMDICQRCHPDDIFPAGCLHRLITQKCYKNFEIAMESLNSTNWCIWGNVSRLYSNLSSCTEEVSDCLRIPWPNLLVEHVFVEIHTKYFKGCPSEELSDPPPGIIFALVITPICLIPVMVSLVVLKTKNGDGSS